MNVFQSLQKQFSGLDFVKNYNLIKNNTLRLNSIAHIFVCVNNSEIFIKLIQFCNQNNIKYLILGGGSNVILHPKINGLVISYQANQISSISETNLLVEAGISLNSLINQSLNEFQLTGLEFFSGIPGSLAGAIYNNAHYKGHFIGDKIVRVQVLTPDNQLKWLNQNQCNFDYDQTIFQNQENVIIQAELKLKHGDIIQAKKVQQEIIQYRQSRHPLQSPSAGCIFKNIKNNSRLTKLFPEFANKKYISTGFIIQQADLKGKK